MENNEFYTWPPKEPKNEKKKPDFKRAGKTMLAVVLAVLLCMFRQAYLQNSFGTAMLCTAAGMVIYELGVFAIGLFLKLTVPGRIAGFLITAVLSLIAAPVLYFIIRSISTVGGEKWKE